MGVGAGGGALRSWGHNNLGPSGPRRSTPYLATGNYKLTT